MKSCENVGGLWQTKSVKSKGVKVKKLIEVIDLEWQIETLTRVIEMSKDKGLDTRSLFIQLTEKQAKLVALLGGDQPDYK